MDHDSSRAEAERWLYTANKLLTARDLHGARSFAIRARESDPRFEATELLLTVIDTLVAGETRINDQHDWYGILQILRYTQNIDYIAAQYRRLALILDPHRNRFAFSGHAFTLVHDAWSVLSNPAKKLLYDNELRMVTGPPQPSAPAPNPFPAPNPVPTPAQRMQHQEQQQQQQQLPSARRNPRSKDSGAVAEEERPSPYNATTETARQDRNSESTRPSTETEVATSFWTACPYCYVLYEYPKVYEECTLRCQSCRRGFQAVKIPSPPVTGKDAYFCCWGFFPLGFSGNFKDISGLSTNWNPFSSMFACPLQKGSKRKSKKGPWVYYDDDVAFVDLSDSSGGDSDVDWRSGGKRNKPRKAKRRVSAPASGNVGKRPVGRPRKVVQSGAGHANLDNGDGGSVVPNAARAEPSKKVASGGSRRRAAADLGKLDLNVEFSNEVEDPNPAASERNVTGNVAEDNIEGIGFFEGLDEFLSSLPILNVVADDKVKGH